MIIVVVIVVYNTLRTSNDFDYLVQLWYVKRHLVKTEWELDVSNFAHCVQISFSATSDIERRIFTYVIRELLFEQSKITS